MARSGKYELFERSLAELRQGQELTQHDIALRLGRPQSFVSKYESGERRLDVVEFLEVCRALNAEPEPIISRLKENGV